MIAAPVAPRRPPVEPTSPLKPSEALRLGRMLHPQIFGPMYEYDDVDDETVVCGSCALGAIAQGGLNPWESNYGPVRCPSLLQPIDWACGNARWIVPSLVAHLNDEHRWETESIALWLEGQGL